MDEINKQTQIIDYLINYVMDNNTAFSEDSVSNLRKLLFLNKSTLQLTIRGLRILSELVASYKILLPEEYTLRSKDLITLNRECSFPFYIHAFGGATHRGEKPFLVVFEKDLATILKLCDGDVDMIREMPRDKIF